MPEWLTFLLADGSAAAVVLWIGAAAAVLGVLWGAVVKLVPLLKKLGNFLDDVGGEPARPGVPARAGLMERVQRIEHELFPNSGKSLRDQTNRIEGLLEKDDARIATLERLSAERTKENP